MKAWLTGVGPSAISRDGAADAVGVGIGIFAGIFPKQRVEHAEDFRLGPGIASTADLADGADAAEALLKNTPGVLRVERSEGDFEVETDMPYEEIPGLLVRLVNGGVRVLFFREQEGTLEDVFMQVTQGGI